MKIILSIISLIAIVYLTYSHVRQELLERSLIESGKEIDAEIVNLQCGGIRDYIHLKVSGKLVSKRIYLDNEDCVNLSQLTTIKVKTNGYDIVFADKSYNDRFEAEIVAILLLGLTAFVLVIWKRLIPEIKRKHYTQG
ncbi:MAG: hypothetical protein ACPGU4_07065 [Flavobacteriales bacterium]